MKRSAADFKRLVRAQTVMADLARLEHDQARAALDKKSQEMASLEKWAARPDAGTLRLLDLYVQRTRALAVEQAALSAQEQDARDRLAGEKARVRPLERQARSAEAAEARKAEEKQLGELLDRSCADGKQASRKARQP